MSGYGHGTLSYNVSESFFKLNCEMLDAELCKLSEEESKTVENNLELFLNNLSNFCDFKEISAVALREIFEKIIYVRSNIGKFVKIESNIPEGALEKLISFLNAASYASEKKCALIKKRAGNNA